MERSRRWFLKECGVGMGALAFHSQLARADDPMSPRKSHHAAKAKNVIYLFQAGAPSHLELFDQKPMLAKFNGQLPAFTRNAMPSSAAPVSNKPRTAGASWNACAPISAMMSVPVTP